LDNGVDDMAKQGAEGKLLESCKRIAVLCLACFAPYSIQATAVSAYSLMDFLDRREVPHTFHVMIGSLSASSRRSPLCRGILKTIWHTLRERELDGVLDETTLKLLKVNAVSAWGSDDHHLFEGSAYPNLAVAREKGREFAEMSDLLLHYSEHNIDDA
jgi:hypothetical protein